MDVDGGSNCHVGAHALGFRRDGMEVTSPFVDGLFSDWDAVEAIWDHALKYVLCLNTIILMSPRTFTHKLTCRKTESRCD